MVDDFFRSFNDKCKKEIEKSFKITIFLKQNLRYVIPTKYLLTRGLLAESTAVFNKLNSANSLQKFTKKVLGKDIEND